jgi:hypothetical protein
MRRTSMITKEKHRIRCFSFTEGKPSRSRAAMTQPARNAGTGRHADPAGPVITRRNRPQNPRQSR